MRSVTGAERAVKAAALTPQMDALLQRIRRAARPPFHTLTPQGARAAYAAGAEILDLPRAPLARVEELVVAGGGNALENAGDRFDLLVVGLL